eukprot:351986-Chlamydomonas_euryale.AAC.4
MTAQPDLTLDGTRCLRLMVAPSHLYADYGWCYSPLQGLKAPWLLTSTDWDKPGAPLASKGPDGAIHL